MGWFICVQPGTGKQYVFCGACGGEFTHTITDEDVDAAGQSAKYNCIIFVKLPWAGGSKVMSIRATEPDDRDMHLLTTLMLLIAHAKASCDLTPGATACLMDMVSRSSDAFNAMVENDAPRKMVTIQRPAHAQLGVMKVDGS